MEISAWLGCFSGWKLDDALRFLRERGATCVEVSYWDGKIGLEYELEELTKAGPRLIDL